MKRFNVRFDPERATALIKARFEQFKKDPEWKNEASVLMINKIRGETRLGTYIVTKENQPPLSEDWIKERKELEKHNPRGISYGGPKKSNLTLTGQLLKSLKRIDDPEKVIVQATGTREPYKRADGSSYPTPPTNHQLVGYLKEQGRKFLGFDEKMVRQIRKKLMEHVRRYLFKR